MGEQHPDEIELSEGREIELSEGREIELSEGQTKSKHVSLENP